LIEPSYKTLFIINSKFNQTARHVYKNQAVLHFFMPLRFESWETLKTFELIRLDQLKGLLIKFSKGISFFTIKKEFNMKMLVAKNLLNAGYLVERLLL